MQEILVPIGVVGMAIAGIVAVTKIIADTRTRRLLIQAGVTAEVARAITAPREDPGLFAALRWGLVLGAVGLALIVVQFLPYRSTDPIAFGVGLLFGGAALLAYYAVAKRRAGAAATPAPSSVT